MKPVASTSTSSPPSSNPLRDRLRELRDRQGSSEQTSWLAPSQRRRRAAETQAEQVILSATAPTQHADFWVCPATGLAVPKRLEANLNYRLQVVKLAGRDESLQRDLIAACRLSPLFWINTFVWTYRQKIGTAEGSERPCVGHEAHYPFVTWLIQDEAIAQIIHAITNGYDVQIVKSRDMGATWLCSAVMQWYLQFVPESTFLTLSRKEDLVDARGNMDSIFEKHRYMLRWQPSWLIPRVKDRHMHIENLDNGSALKGESTNQHAGQGGRNTAIFCDEFSRVQNGEEIVLATADTTACRIFNSTPQGPGNAFHRLWQEKRAKLVVMPWWRHPEKGLGAYQVLDHETQKPRWISPWYEREKLSRSRKDVASNLDMDFGAAGEIFFDPEEVERHRRAHVRVPLRRGRLMIDAPREDDRQRIVRERLHKRVKFEDAERGGWRLWVSLDRDGRPPQNHLYVMSADVSNGAGESNSVITVAAADTGQVVAKFWDAGVSPEGLADEITAAAVWFGGKRGCPFVIWENNGPGGITGRKLCQHYKYPYFYRQKQVESVREKRGQQYGWHSNAIRKELLLGQYREAIKTDRLINPCNEALDECLDYIYDENGQLLPGKLKEEKHGGRALHGDHVIADALVVLGMESLGRIGAAAAKPPGGSWQWRKDSQKRQLLRTGDDFRD